jgi:hypothetical protein
MSIRNESDCDSSLDPARAFRHVTGNEDRRYLFFIVLMKTMNLSYRRSGASSPPAGGLWLPG